MDSSRIEDSSALAEGTLREARIGALRVIPVFTHLDTFVDGQFNLPSTNSSITSYILAVAIGSRP
jgi:hypothetical protein